MSIEDDAQEFSLRPVTLIEWPLPFCTLYWGTGVCAPRSTLQSDFESAAGFSAYGAATNVQDDPANYTQGTQGVKFDKNGTAQQALIRRELTTRRSHVGQTHRASFFIPNQSTLSVLVDARVFLYTTAGLVDWAAWTFPAAGLQVGLNLLTWNVDTPVATAGAWNPASVIGYAYGVWTVAAGSLITPVTFDDHLRLRTFTSPCYNTAATCQDRRHFFVFRGQRVYRFTMASGPVIKGLAGPDPLHCISAIDLVPTVIDQERGYGQRDFMSVTMTDFKDEDLGVDPYRSIRKNPPEGTYLRKFVARNPYVKNSLMTLREGFGIEEDPNSVRVDLQNFSTRQYVTDRMDGPDKRGKFKVVAKDLLKLLDGTLIPGHTDAELTKAMTNLETDTTLELRPGDVDTLLAQAASVGTSLPFYVAVDNEAMLLTTLTPGATLVPGVVRARLGSKIEEHDTEAQVQFVQSWTSSTPVDIWEFLQVQSGVEPGLIALAEAQSEQSISLSDVRFTAHITRPTKASEIMADLNDQLGSATWWESEDQTTRFRPTRPVLPGELVKSITDENALIGDTVELQRLEAQRITACLYSFEIINWMEDLKQPGNYSRSILHIDADAESVIEYDDEKTRRVFGYFLAASEAAVARSIAARYVARFRDPPESVKARMTAKDAVGIKAGDIVNLKTFALLDSSGAEKEQAALVVYKKRVAADSISWEFGLVSYVFAQRFGFWTDDPFPDYVDATEAEKQFNAFWADEDGLVEGDDPYLWA